MPGAPVVIDKALQSGSGCPSGLSGDERHACEQLKFFNMQLAYSQMMGSRPQTLTRLPDSPVGLAAFMLDHDARAWNS
ncbi:hypothetical protein [Bacillus sp. 3255]|uniref:hypothetical protein n=1 Tax=Bacillus sp. 3255 TaxID=2817904 RepID=UPI00286C8601|nr:hypothetical protein [Bacillus sp. 3255]